MILEARLIISNNDTCATGSAQFECDDPVTGKMVTRTAAASVADAERAANTAACALLDWSKTPPTERRVTS